MQYYIFSTIAQIAVLVRELFLKYWYITSASIEYKFKCFSPYVKELSAAGKKEKIMQLERKLQFPVLE
jgi:hypothetical protein